VPEISRDIAARCSLSDEFIHPSLDDGAFSSVDNLYFEWIDIHPNNLMSFIS
jgi:hypothetical protein